MKRDINNILNDCIGAIINNEKTLEECLLLFNEERNELEPMLKAALSLIEAGQITPNAERKQQARERLMAAVDQKRWEVGIERVPMEEKTTVGAGRLRTVFRRLGVITLVFAILSGGTLAMAKESLPGSPLYALKLTAEEARIRLASDDNEKARLYLEAAGKRISELEKIGKDDKSSAGLIDSIAKNIEAANLAAGDENPAYKAAMADLVRKNEAVLRDVLERVPENAKPAIERALSNSKERTGVEQPDNDSAVEDRGLNQDRNQEQKFDGKPSENNKGLTLPQIKQPEIKKPSIPKGNASDNTVGTDKRNINNQKPTTLPVAPGKAPELPDMKTSVPGQNDSPYNKNGLDNANSNKERSNNAAEGWNGTR